MDEMQRIHQILTLELFQLGGQPINLLQLLLVLAATLGTWGLSRIVGRVSHSRLHGHVDAGPRHTLVHLLQYAIWGVGFLISLRLLNIKLTALAVTLGVLGVGLGFGLQTLVANFVAGLVLLFERPIRLNDFVTTGTVEGRVQEVGFRSTTILTNDNISIIVPNSEFVNSTVINWSHGDPLVRIHIPVGVAYGSDVSLVTQTLLGCAVGLKGVLETPAAGVWFRAFGDSALEFELRVWIDQPVEHERLRSQLHYAIDAAFRVNNIQIPFPQRDLHVRSDATRLEPLVRRPDDP